ncbi:MAG: peptidylprolyl isomerase [Lentisphaerae bacterium]|nr:peptidylprolyl isomerase [Lentisphaerota bacterium]
MNRWIAIALVLTALGCSKKKDAASTPSAASEDEKLGNLPAITVPAGEDTVLVTVGEHKLMRSQAEQDIDVRVSAAGNRLPPEKVAAFRQDVLSKLIEQFVVRSVLLDEAKRQNIEVTEEDQQKALAKVSEFLEKQGRTLEEALSGSPLGRERMLEEVRTGVTIDKLLAANLPAIGEPTDKDIAAFKAENADKLSKPERAHAHHILLSIDTNADETTKQARKAEAVKLQQKLVAGASFEETARSSSDCPSSARGGDLGWFERGQMVPAFEAAAFSQPTGAVGGIVESPFGYHIIRVDERIPGGEASREEIANLLKQRQRPQLFKDYIGKLMATAKIEYAASITSAVPESVAK